MPIYEVRPRKDHRGFDLISDALPFGRLWYGEVSDAVENAKFYSRAHASRRAHYSPVRSWTLPASEPIAPGPLQSTITVLPSSG